MYFLQLWKPGHPESRHWQALSSGTTTFYLPRQLCIESCVCKGQRVNILGFAGLAASDTSNHLCCPSVKVATDNPQMHERGCASRILFMDSEI